MTMDEEALRAWALEAGFAQCALCGVQDFGQERLRVAQQPPLAERRQLRFSPQEDWPEAKSLAVLLWPYRQAAPARPGAVWIDSYYAASNAAYHAARRLEDRLAQAGIFARANVSYPARRAAVRAGMGFIGKNDLLITPEHGTRVVIILMATAVDAPQRPVRQAPGQTCLSCGRCAAACPSGALGPEGMTHPERCMRNFTMEGVVVPEQLRQRMGMCLLGCDICQRVCPMQPDAGQADEPAFALDDFMTADDAAFSSAVTRLAAQIGRNAARPQRVRAQAALLAGNSRKPEYLPVLQRWAQSDFEAVRAHAQWAISRLSGLDLESQKR